MEPYQLALLIIIGIAFSIFIYYWGKQTGRMQMINELSGSKGDWDGRSARQKMFIALWNSIRGRYTEENLPTGLATFFRETIGSLFSMFGPIKQLRSIISGEIDDLENKKEIKRCPHYKLLAGDGFPLEGYDPKLKDKPLSSGYQPTGPRQECIVPPKPPIKE